MNGPGPAPGAAPHAAADVGADVGADVELLDDDDRLASFEDFYVREFARVRALARALAGPAGADDVAQEAMLVAYRRWRQVSQLSDPAMWVRRVCANMATSQLRRRGAEARAVLRLGSRIRPALVDSADDGFWGLVRGLPRRQAQAITLYYLFDLSVAEVAATLEVREGSVKSHLARGRAALAHRLSLPGGESL
ncbi:MAG: RNA polymerase sigma factor [Actinomycetales bacterium]